jgi:hypothetical protein
MTVERQIVREPEAIAITGRIIHNAKLSDLD